MHNLINPLLTTAINYTTILTKNEYRDIFYAKTKMLIAGCRTQIELEVVRDDLENVPFVFAHVQDLKNNKLFLLANREDEKTALDFISKYPHLHPDIEAICIQKHPKLNPYDFTKTATEILKSWNDKLQGWVDEKTIDISVDICFSIMNLSTVKSTLNENVGTLDKIETKGNKLLQNSREYAKIKLENASQNSTGPGMA